MNLSAPFIKRPVMTILVMTTILFFGIACYKFLPVSDLPTVEYPTIQVTTSYPGASPQTVANTVTTPLEKQFLTIQGIQSISSQSNTGTSTIVLQFALNKDLNSAATDTQAAISRANQQLPKDLPYAPSYNTVNPTDTPILYWAITSAEMTLGDLYDYVDNVVAQQIDLVNGVSQVITYGQPFAVRVRLDPQKLAAKGISFAEAAQAISQANPELPTGILYGPNHEYLINVFGQMDDASLYNKVILKSTEGQIVRVEDVGEAINSLQNDKYYLHYIDQNFDEPCVLLAVQKQLSANAIAVIDQIDALLPKLVRELPGSVTIHDMFDKSQFIRESVADVQLTLSVAIALVVIIIFLYLGTPINSLIPMLALPMSIIGTCVMMYLAGFSIDILSMLAITLSVGFLVDDAIVVLENIVRHVEGGAEPMQAAIDGSREISVTILSMTLSLSCVFIPLLCLGGIVGRILHEFSFTILTAVMISGFISLSLTPMLCSRLIPKKSEETKRTRLEKFSEGFNQKLLSSYSKALDKVIHYKKSVLFSGLACIAGAALLYLHLPQDFMPGDDLGFIEGFSQAQDGTSPFQMMDYQRDVTKLVRARSEVDAMVSVGALPMDNQGLFFIRLKPYKERPPIMQVVQSLFRELFEYPGMQVFFRPLPLLSLQVGTTTSMGDYQLSLQALKAEDLYQYGPLMYQRMQTTPGITQVSTDLRIKEPQLNVEILRDRASILGVSANSIETALKWAYSTSNLSPINEPDNQYYVITETPPQFYSNPIDLSQIYVGTNRGALVPINQVAKITETIGPLSVNHLNGLPSNTISFNLVDMPLSKAILAIQNASDQLLPPRITSTMQGNAEVFLQSFQSLNILLFITVFVIYVLLGILYENFFHPITVMTTLPPAAVGGLLALFVTGNTLSIYGFVGIILLLGIVLKNGIILVDFANEAVRHGKSPEESVLYACKTRFRPILMTTISALMGAVPIALGIGGSTAQSRRPLGYVIIGGLVVSQLLTLFLTPVVYIYIERLREWRRAP